MTIRITRDRLLRLHGKYGVKGAYLLDSLVLMKKTDSEDDSKRIIIQQ